MNTNNSDKYLKYLLSGRTPSAASTLLEQISVEEMIFELSSLPSDCFIPYTPDPEDDSPDFDSLDEKYVGNLIIRCLDSILDKRDYERIFNNDHIVEIIKEGIRDANYHVKRLISKHLRKFIENGGRNDHVYEIEWTLLFDKEYGVFEDSSNSIRVICSRPGEEFFLNEERVNEFMRYLSGDEKNEDLDTVTMSLRMMEFATILGKDSQRCFELLREKEVYDQIFRIYMENDVLVKLNCIEIMDSMVPLIKKLKFESESSREFVKYSMELFVGKGEDYFGETVTGPLLRFFSTIVGLNNVLSEDEIDLFSKCVEDNILNKSQSKSIQYYSSLASFGSLFVRGYLSQRASEKFLDVVKNCDKDDVLYPCLESLEFISMTKDLTKSKFMAEAASAIASTISRFQFSEVRGACFCFLTNSLEFNQVAEVLVESEKKFRFLSTQENIYENTLAKRELIRKFLKKVEELYSPGPLPLSESLVRTLKSI